MNKKIFVFGNQYLDDDNFSFEVAKEIDAEIIYCKSPDDLLDEEGEILILDVVKNIKEPVLLEDVDKIKSRNLLSLHDFDLGYFLKLLKELDDNRKIRIIGIPQSGNAQEVSKKVLAWI